MSFADQCRELSATAITTADANAVIYEAQAKQFYEKLKVEIESIAKDGYYWHDFSSSNKIVGYLLNMLNEDGFKVEYLRDEDTESDISINWFE